MQSKTLENIRASEILPVAWREKLALNPNQILNITIDIPSEDEDLTPEEKIKPEFIAEMERRERENKLEDAVVCQTEEEVDDFFKKIMKEDD